ncbi:hypothetical protein [Aeromicrobium sp.]|uniref:hypothetical protein n=1 Tax=Aeromicrobium sp. TaxID=1871063 RepID=UPI0019B4D4FD|nr:hypothetical protein [Aeromicrobium sp.]MBC7632219.1 hypothetical protein [Aeromicrobium sp.]
MRAHRLRAGLVLGFASTLILSMVAAGGQSAVAAPSSSDEGAFKATKTVTREFRDARAGTDDVVDSRNFTLSVDHTRNLRGRERLKISWSGARPSAGRAADPYGENGLNQEYPVLIMQCRGTDDSSLPVARQLRPETCWTSTRQQRSQSADDLFAVWRHDLYSTTEQRAKKTGLGSIPSTCADDASYSTHLTPFVAAGGTVFSACTAETMPPEAAVGAAFPPAEVAAFSDVDGKGQLNYEVRSATENESLGCSEKTACSIVAIPIMGLSCVDNDRECRKDGRLQPGSNNFSNEGVDAAVSPVYWWSESNWRNRVTVPLSFGLPPDACDVLDKRAPTPFYGSELMSQAALQWSPAYCLRKDRFKFQHNRLGDEPAFALVEKGEAPAAFVSGNRERSTTDPIGYAPTALTGFAVAFIVDRPGNQGEKFDLNLTPRLLAKLLSQSYTGSRRGQQHPGIEKNPLSLNLDLEFQALNPGLDSIAREAAATVLSLSESSDVIKTLTSYLEDDPEAKAFLEGVPDPWGMVVNPSYRDVKLPTSEFPLLDRFEPTSDLQCLKENPAPYFGQLAAPVTSLRKIAEAVLDAWPNVQTKCDRASSSDPFKVGRVDRQGIGTRFMLGVVSLGDAARFGLRTAALQTTSTVSPTAKFTSSDGRTFIAPTNESVSAAAEVAKPQGVRRAFALDMQTLRKTPTAYPGTMIVYTTAKLDGLAKSDALKVAEFIRIATTEGQVRGSGNGKLPDGFVPIKSTGVTAALYTSAQDVAGLIAAQKGPKANSATTPAIAPGGGGAAAAGPGDANIPTDAVPKDAKTSTAPTETADTVATASSSPGPAGVLLPLLIALAVLAGLGGPATRLVATWRARP